MPTPGGVRSGAPTRCHGPQARITAEHSAHTARRRVTCSPSNAHVSFARPHGQRDLRGPDDRRLPPARARGRGRDGGSLPRRAPRARPLCVQVLRPRLRSDPVAVKRFLREAGYGARVVHPSVVRTYEYGEADGLHYLALEWAGGESLAQFLHRNGPLAPADAAAVTRQLAAGLSAAHQAGIIHRDLKPENIVYDAPTRQVKLLDFGIARDA